MIIVLSSSSFFAHSHHLLLVLGEMNHWYVIELRLAILMTFQPLGLRLRAANLGSAANTDLMADSAWSH